MNVGELIVALAAFPSDAKVRRVDSQYGNLSILVVRGETSMSGEIAWVVVA
jgi:hypothetical protein